MATLANLVVRITGNTASLNKAVSKAETRMGKFSKAGSKALKAVGTAAKGLAIGGAAALVGFGIAGVKAFVSLGDELDKMSKRTGFSVEALGELKFAAEQSGASLETIEKAAKRMASTVFDAGLGLKSTTDSLDALGISVADLQGLSPEQQFQLFANALSGVEDASTRAALAQDIFGRSGTELLPLFTQGEQGMAALREQAQQLGVVMSGDAATAAADFADAQNELKSALSGVFLEVGSKIVPKLTEFVRKVISWKPQIIAFFTGIKDAAAPFFSAFVTGIATILPIVGKFVKFFLDNHILLIAAIVAVGVAFALAMGTTGIVVLAILGLITLVGVLKKNWETIWAAVANFFIDVVNKIIDGINTVTGIFSKLPGVADFELGKFEKIVVDAADTTDELTKAAEEVTPAVKDVGWAAQDATPQVNGLSTATEDLGEAVLTTAERVRDWKKAQEEAGRAGSDMESQYRGQVIPTLSDLIAKQEEEVEAQRKVENAWRDLGVVTDEISRQIESDELRKTRAADAHVLALDTAAEAQRMAHEKAGKAATDAATEIEAAAIKAATAAQNATDRMNASWDTYIVNQDSVVAAMRANSISFEDVVDGLAKSFGISTVDMAAKAKEMGVSYNDTMALMEAFGRQKINAIIGQMNAAAAAAAASKTAYR